MNNMSTTCLNAPAEMPSVALNLVLAEARVYMNFEECCCECQNRYSNPPSSVECLYRGSLQAGNGFTDSGLGEVGQSQQPPSIIILSYVLRFNALPGIETEIPLIITSHPFCNGAMEQVVEEEEEEWVDQPQEVYKKTAGPSNMSAPLNSAIAGRRLRNSNNAGPGRRVSIFETDSDGGALYFR
uniref:Uncharacterized protein n=1 Tax=Ditylenchus dipsaci TaxID=166011 RepID=A0A915E6W6_9BILA